MYTNSGTLKYLYLCIPLLVYILKIMSFDWDIEFQSTNKGSFLAFSLCFFLASYSNSEKPLTIYHVFTYLFKSIIYISGFRMPNLTSFHISLWMSSQFFYYSCMGLHCTDVLEFTQPRSHVWTFRLFPYLVITSSAAVSDLMLVCFFFFIFFFLSF